MDKNLRDEVYYTSRFLKEENRKGKSLVGDLAITLGVVGAVAAGGLIGYMLSRKKEEPITQTSSVTTTTVKPTPETTTVTQTVTQTAIDTVFAYALKKLPEQEALKFKNVENFNASSIALVDLYASLPPEKRNSKEVNDLLNQILLDNIIDELEKNLFDDKFVHPTLPSIENLSWIPTRENLDKIYDINVTFVAKDDKTPIAYAELHFVPVEYYYMIEKYGMRPEDYPKVFPPDKERALVLTPVDGKFDSLEEKFSVTIKDIVGGREYKIVVLVRDLAGNEKIVEVKTPYIRQFENIAKTDDITVVALYLLWWGKDNNWVNYKGNIFPLLGNYSSKDKIVINKHVDWATGHGIDVFLINWSGQDYQDDALKNYFLEADLVKRGDIRFMILYESTQRLKDSNPGWNLSDPRNVQILDSDFLYLSQNYLEHPSYFKINNRPALYLYEGKGIFGDVSQIDKLKEKFGLFIISDHAHPLANPNDIFPQNNPLAVRWGDAAKQFDAILPGGGLYSGFLWYRGYFSGLSVENPLDNNKWLEYKKIGNDRWSEFARMNNMFFFPSVTVGISYRYAPWGDSNWPILERSPQQLKERLEFELKYLEKYPKILFINEFNNFFEEAQLEPDSEYGFSLLQLIKDVLRPLMKNLAYNSKKDFKYCKLWRIVSL